MCHLQRRILRPIRSQTASLQTPLSFSLHPPLALSPFFLSSLQVPITRSVLSSHFSTVYHMGCLDFASASASLIKFQSCAKIKKKKSRLSKTIVKKIRPFTHKLSH
ncbi:hypothetical protein ACOSQ4_019314 [Xanthoceras sorbifolium]